MIHRFKLRAVKLKANTHVVWLRDMITCCLHELQICSSMGNSEIRVDGFFLCMDGQPEFPVELQFCMQLCFHMINTCSIYMLVDKNLCWEQISYFAWSYILKFGIPIVALFLVHQFQKAMTYPWSLRAVRFMQRSINLSFKKKTKILLTYILW